MVTCTPMSAREYKYLSIRVHGVNPYMQKELRTIAKNKGLSVSKMLKPILQEYINSTPPRLRLEWKSQD
jgi:hypothetical protein